MMRRRLRWLPLLFAGMLVGVCPVAFGQASAIFLGPADAGLHDGSSCANAHVYTWFNTAANWGTGATQIGASATVGTTVTLCAGTPYNIAAGTTGLTFQAAGTATHPITLQFQDSTVVLQSPHFGPNGAIAMNFNNLVFNGNGGLIQNTLAGSPGATCPAGPCQQFYGILNNYGTRTVGINSTSCSNCVIQNVKIENLYVHTKCTTTLGRWQPNHSYALNAQIIGYPGYLETATTGGTSGSAEPTAASYTTTGQSTTDGSVTWQTGAFTCDIMADFENFEGIFGSAENGTQTVHDLTISNDGAGYVQYSGGGPSQTIEIYNFDMSRFDHGFFGGNAVNIKIHNGRMHDSDNWDTGSGFQGPDEYHHDGIHIAANTSTTNFYLYNSFFDGNEGDCCITSWMFLQGNPVNQYVYNNVFLSKATGNFFESGTLGYYVANTFIAQNVVGGATASCFSSTATTQFFEDNVESGCGQFFTSPSGTTALTSNGNVYVSYQSTGNPTWTYAAKGISTSTFATWQAGGFDPTPSGGNPGTYYNAAATLNAQLTDQIVSPFFGQPTTGFQGAAIGVNLTSLAFTSLTSDTSLGWTTTTGLPIRTPVARPSSGNWDSGAYVASTTSPPGLSLSSPTIAFGTVILTKNATGNVTVTNTSSSTGVTFTSKTISGTNAADFALTTDGCGGSLAASANCMLTVTFTPSAAPGTAETATLSLADNATGSPQTVALTGTAGNQVSISPASLSFGNVISGTTSGQQIATLTNNGGSSLTGISVAYSGASQFSLVTPQAGSDCRTVGSLAANGQCNVALLFSPNSITSFSGTVSITDSAAGSPQTIAVTGTGAASVISISPTPLNFGTVGQGSTSPSQSTTITVQASPLILSSVTLTGTNAADFAIGTNTCTGTVTSSCSTAITFTPSTTASEAATLNYSGNQSGTPSQVSLSGTGQATGGTTATLSPGSLSFGKVAIGNTSAQMITTLTNTGTGTLSSIVVSLTGASQFSLVSPSSGTDCRTAGSLTAGSSCNVAAVFTPNGNSNFSATISISDSATGSPQTCALSGKGQNGNKKTVGSPGTSPIP